MLPDPITKRDMLWAAQKKPVNYSAQAEAFLAAGWLADASAFFLKAGDKSGVARVVEAALKEGDAAILGRIAAAMPDAVARDTWQRCAQEAERLEKHSFARTAWEKAGQPDKAAAARARVLSALGYSQPKATPNESSPPGNPQQPQA